MLSSGSVHNVRLQLGVTERRNLGHLVENLMRVLLEDGLVLGHGHRPDQIVHAGQEMSEIGHERASVVNESWIL